MLEQKRFLKQDYVNMTEEEKKEMIEKYMKYVHENLFIKQEKKIITSREMVDFLSTNEREYRHGNLISIIRKIIDKIDDKNFINEHISESTYFNSQNKEQPCYNMSIAGYTLVSLHMHSMYFIHQKEAIVRMYNIMDSDVLHFGNLSQNLNETIDVTYNSFDFKIINRNFLIVSSIKLANILEKEHYNLLAKIEETLSFCTEEFGRLNFKFTSTNVSQPNGGYRDEHEYYMTRDGFLFLISNMIDENDYIGKIKLQFMKSFDEASKSIINFIKNKEIDAFAKDRIKLNESISKLANDVNSLDSRWKIITKEVDLNIKSIFDEAEKMYGSRTITITTFVSKIIYLNESFLDVNKTVFEMNNFLESKGLIYLPINSTKESRIPFDKYIEIGLFNINTGKDNNENIYRYTVLTENGAKWLYLLRYDFIEYIAMCYYSTFRYDDNYPFAKYDIIYKKEYIMYNFYKKISCYSKSRN